jgi:hypothetical protein
MAGIKVFLTAKLLKAGLESMAVRASKNGKLEIIRTKYAEDSRYRCPKWR